MKNILFVLTAILILTTVSIAQVKTGEKTITINKVTGDTTYTESVIISESEDITPRNNMIVINPLKFFLLYNISYFHKISESTDIGFGIQTPTIEGVSGIGFNFEVRYHPKGKNMGGFYIAPNVSYNILSSTSSSGSDTKLSSIGGLLGWQWFPGDEFAIGLGIGIDLYTGSQKDGWDIYENYEGLMPAVRFDIGYAW
ncbi:MAG: hypothetical protein KKF62_04600 [Bacteroidetes bacterium]|nr:hypothetical protein [Bacteroidota bacterium]MBU1114276.1 hypothetical protein [Bacteroidota bacterium]MBU1798013.1 hypothetical protein [Bacteroidota bacterium]